MINVNIEKNFLENLFSTLNDTGHLVYYFFYLMENMLCYISIMAWEVSRLITGLYSPKATGQDKILVVLKNFSPELTSILAKLFSYCLKENVSKVYGKCLPCLQECRGEFNPISISTHQPL